MANEDSTIPTENQSVIVDKESKKETTTPEKAADPASWRTIPFDPSVRHPLKHGWSLWYDAQMKDGRKPQVGQWGEGIKEIFAFQTVEDFWRMYNNVAPPSQIPMGCTYNLFKKGIEPKWEDLSNSSGGKWTLIIAKKNSSVKEVDKLWLWMVLACIGEIIDEDDQICGCVVNVRKQQDKLCLWTKESDCGDVLMRIGQNLKLKALELPDNFPCGFQSHFGGNAHSNLYSV